MMVKMEHVLMLAIVLLILYHFIGRCGCANGVVNGFSVGGIDCSNLKLVDGCEPDSRKSASNCGHMCRNLDTKICNKNKYYADTVDSTGNTTRNSYQCQLSTNKEECLGASFDFALCDGIFFPEKINMSIDISYKDTYYDRLHNFEGKYNILFKPEPNDNCLHCGGFNNTITSKELISINSIDSYKDKYGDGHINLYIFSQNPNNTNTNSYISNISIYYMKLWNSYVCEIYIYLTPQEQIQIFVDISVDKYTTALNESTNFVDFMNNMNWDSGRVKPSNNKTNPKKLEFDLESSNIHFSL